MKKFVLLFLVVFTFSCSSDDPVTEVEKTITAVPDEVFEQILIDQGYDSDQTINGMILYADAKKITELDISTQSEYDLKGIEDFINLTSLVIQNGRTSIVDLYANTSLTELKLSNTIIANFLTLPSESNLRTLFVQNTGLKLLNLRDNTELDSLIVSSSALQSLNINASEKLRFLDLKVYTDDFLELDISDNINLEEVDLRLYNITAIDISKLTKLKTLDIVDNPKLVCAKIFENQDISDFKYGYHTTFTTDCNNLPEKEYTLIPNESLERLFIAQNIDTEDKLDGKVITESLENAKRLYVGGRQSLPLESFEGLETLINLEWIYFESLEKLNIEDYDFRQHPKLANFGLDNYGGMPGQKVNIDLSQLENLENLYLWSADIDNLDFGQCPELKEVAMSRINPMDFDFTENVKLESINIEDVNSLDVTQCLNLEELEVSSSTLQSVNLSNNTGLKKLKLRTPMMTNLNIGNLNLEEFTLNTLQLSTTEVNDLIKDQSNLLDLELIGMEINNNLDLKNNTLLKILKLDSAPIDNLDISENKNLVWLTIWATNIENLDVTNNTSIKRLYLSRNKLLTIDLQGLNDLLHFGVHNNNLVSLDISTNLSLKFIDVQNNPDLNCIKVSENQMITSTNNGLDSHQSFSTNCN